MTSRSSTPSCSSRTSIRSSGGASGSSRTSSAATRRRPPKTPSWRSSRPRLDAGKPALIVDLDAEERAIARPLFLLSDKPTIFACNVKEADLATADTNPYVLKVRQYVETHLACEAIVVSAQIESDLVDLEPGGGGRLPEGARRRGERRRRADPRDLPPARACRPISPPARKRSGPGPSMSATPRRRPPA